MTGYESKKAMAQDKLEQWGNEAFNAWWDSDSDGGSANPFSDDTFAYWAWAGWQAALAQPAQEPVEDVVEYFADGTRIVRIAPQREWVGLTRDEVLGIEEITKHPLDFYRAIEAALKERNA